MKSLLHLSFFFLSSYCSAQEWQSFIDIDSLFSIEVQGDMLSKEKSVLTGIESINLYSYYSNNQSPEADNFLYLVNVADYPEGTFPKDSTQLRLDFLNESIISLALNHNGKVDYQKTLDKGHGGILARISQADKDIIIKAIVLIAEDRFYTLQVFTQGDKSLNPSVDRFLNSFRLL